ncbi:MAG: ArsR family transcriptional regulator [Parcubacteria group bacterium GW2011_GWC2_45_7]|nr:MAG: ArsR family transcriptional regulator [Parcubacteria group bacterium GW2011_GWC2_45_7]KKU73187.1 MAG: ArsR family transcriptional regulator [Parcubacteria group bacterium GW2011_GWA2_47_26]
MKEWTKIFKALANENRLAILKAIVKHDELSVKMICQKLDKGVKLVSKHLGILAYMNIVEGQGKLGSVWYKLHPSLRLEVKTIIHKFLK